MTPLTLPSTYRAWRRNESSTAIELTSGESMVSPDSLGPDDVLMRIRTVSLNFRDVAMIHDRYIKPVVHRGVTGSDCAAEVVATGSAVTKFKCGDRVSIVYDLNNLDNEDKGEMAALGGEEEGVLREYAVYKQQTLVHVPEHLSWEEASTLTCAGVTAWTSLRLPASAHKGNSALLQGTGGVSMFALLLCLRAGIFPIITSSSDQKLDKIKRLAPPGAIGTINYKSQDVVAEAKQLTHGKGVDVVVNNIGVSSINDDMAMLRRRGTISLVGFLGTNESPLDAEIITEIIVKAATMTGIYVGSIQDFAKMNSFIAEHRMKLDSVLDKTFAFEDADEAFEYLYQGKHVGKVIIKVA